MVFSAASWRPVVMRSRFLGTLCVALGLLSSNAALTNSTLLDLNQLPFFLGREYFVLRSGRAQMIIQADRADLGPAFTYLLFDAANARQSVTKDGAFNYVPGEGFGSSALVVELGGFPFTALGHRTATRWVLEDDIPVVQAVWWAGGIRVTELISALSTNGLFRRDIILEGANLVGDEKVKLKLYLPRGGFGVEGKVVHQTGRGARLALASTGHVPSKPSPDMGVLEIGPVVVSPGTSVSIPTFLFAQIPAADET